jgi:hypothetical protein
MDDLQVLTTSIGEFTVDVLGRDALRDLQVTLDVRSLDCHIAIALEDNSERQQRAVIKELLDIERMYFDEVVLSFSFVESIERDPAELSAVPQYSFA